MLGDKEDDDALKDLAKRAFFGPTAMAILNTLLAVEKSMADQVIESFEASNA